MGSSCTVIILTKGSQDRYDIRQTLVVNTTKIIIGNPIDLPVLNATNRIERLFDGASPATRPAALIGLHDGRRASPLAHLTTHLTHPTTHTHYHTSAPRRLPGHPLGAAL